MSHRFQFVQRKEESNGSFAIRVSECLFPHIRDPARMADWWAAAAGLVRRQEGVTAVEQLEKAHCGEVDALRYAIAQLEAERDDWRELAKALAKTVQRDE